MSGGFDPRREWDHRSSGEDFSSSSRLDVEVECPCGHRFFVARRLQGALVNCPKCGRATEAPGAFDPLFWLIAGGGVAVAAVVCTVIFLTAGPVAGTIAVLCAVVILWLISLSF